MSDVHWRHPSKDILPSTVRDVRVIPTLCGDVALFRDLRYLTNTRHITEQEVTCTACVLLRFEGESQGRDWQAELNEVALGTLGRATKLLPDKEV